MKKLLFVISGLMTVCILTSQDLKLDDILARNFKAIGQEKMAKIQTIKISGKMIGGNMEIPFTIVQKLPNLRRSDFDMQGTKFVQSFDGQNGWTIMPQSGSLEPQDMSPETTKTFTDENDESYASWDNPFFTWERLGNKLELVGKEILSGVSVYNIKITSKDNKVDNYFLDADKFLVLRTKEKEMKQGMMVETETVYGDFKEVDGVLCALNIEIIENGQTSVVIKIDKYDFNTPFDNAFFKKPVTDVK
jgi:outer membrane lipoprotein-sorting protein